MIINFAGLYFSMIYRIYRIVEQGRDNAIVIVDLITVTNGIYSKIVNYFETVDIIKVKIA